MRSVKFWKPGDRGVSKRRLWPAVSHAAEKSSKRRTEN